MKLMFFLSGGLEKDMMSFEKGPIFNVQPKHDKKKKKKQSLRDAANFFYFIFLFGGFEKDMQRLV
jgi:hypothetical protein